MTHLLLKTETNLLPKTDLNISFWNDSTCMTHAGGSGFKRCCKACSFKGFPKLLAIAIIAPIIMIL